MPSLKHLALIAITLAVASCRTKQHAAHVPCSPTTGYTTSHTQAVTLHWADSLPLKDLHTLLPATIAPADTNTPPGRVPVMVQWQATTDTTTATITPTTTTTTTTTPTIPTKVEFFAQVGKVALIAIAVFVLGILFRITKV